jgi:hypothetical protein
MHWWSRDVSALWLPMKRQQNINIVRFSEIIGLPSPHLRTETDPVSETSCFLVSRIPDNGKSPKIPVIRSVIHHRQDPLESTVCESMSHCPSHILLHPVVWITKDNIYCIPVNTTLFRAGGVLLCRTCLGTCVPSWCPPENVWSGQMECFQCRIFT